MNVAVPNQTYYEWYNRSDRLRMRYPCELVVGFLVNNLEPGARVLDLGCGSGRHVLLAAELGHRATGVDLAPAGLEACAAEADRRGLAVELRRAGMATTGLESAAFDAVVCCNALGGNPLAEQTRIVAEIARVLRPGGALLANFYGPRDAVALRAGCEGRPFEVVTPTPLVNGGAGATPGAATAVRARPSRDDWVLPSYGAGAADADTAPEFVLHVSSTEEVAALLGRFRDVRQFDVHLPFGNASLAEDPAPVHLLYALARR